MHKSQGFGAAERRGTWMNDFKLVAGEPATSDLFEGVDLSWKRYGEKGEDVGKILRKVDEGFRDTDPAASVPGLVEAWTAIGRLIEAGAPPAAPPSPSSPSKKSESSSSSSDPLLAAKRAEVVDAIRACLGLWTEAIAADVSAAPGAEVKVATMILNRSSVPATLEKVEVTHAAAPLAGGALAPNEPVRGTATLALPADAAITQPYWLRAPAGKGLYAVPDPTLVGRPENAPPLVARFAVRVAGTSIPFETPVVFRRTDPVKGEVYRPFEIVPPVTANFDDKVYAFGSGAAKTVRVTLVAGGAEGLGLASPEGSRGVPRLPLGGPLRARRPRRGEGGRVHADASVRPRRRNADRRDDRRREGRLARARPRRLSAHPRADALPARGGDASSGSTSRRRAFPSATSWARATPAPTRSGRWATP